MTYSQRRICEYRSRSTAQCVVQSSSGGQGEERDERRHLMERNRGRTGARLLHSHARGLHELVAVPAILVYEIGRDGRVVSGFLYSTPTRRVGRLSVRGGISLRPVVFYELFHRDLKSASMTSFVVTFKCLISAVSTIEFSKYTLEWYNGEVGKIGRASCRERV